MTDLYDYYATMPSAEDILIAESMIRSDPELPDPEPIRWTPRWDKEPEVTFDDLYNTTETDIDMVLETEEIQDTKLPASVSV